MEMASRVKILMSVLPIPLVTSMPTALTALAASPVPVAKDTVGMESSVNPA
jgi:hypothetical protein